MAEIGLHCTGNVSNQNNKDGPPNKIAKVDAEVGQKNPVMLLHEVMPNVTFEISESGPPHARIFLASVTINGNTYSAEERTKKKAKTKVADVVLKKCYNKAGPSSNNSPSLVASDLKRTNTPIPAPSTSGNPKDYKFGDFIAK